MFSDQSTSTHRRGFTLVEFLVIVVVVISLVILFLPSVRSARTPAYRTLCLNNMRNIAKALQSYHASHQAFPPAYTVDEHGRPLHSWRVLILPYLEQGTLYQQIDLTKPWDDPVNAEARQAMPRVFECPSTRSSTGMTTYLAVVGEQCSLHPIRPRSSSEITDPHGQTLLLVDVPGKHAVHWMSPRDADAVLLQGVFAGDWPHTGGTNAMFADGSGRMLNGKLQESTIRCLSTIAGGETLGEF